MLELLAPTMDMGNIFTKTFDELNQKFDCNYLFYQYQHLNFKLTFATHSEWMNVYVNKSMISNCPLVRVGLQRLSSPLSSVILRWNDVLPISKEEKNTIGIRGDFNICNGISFGRRRFGATEYFGLASDIKHLDFARKITLNSFYVKSMMDCLCQAATIKYLSHNFQKLIFQEY